MPTILNSHILGTHITALVCLKDSLLWFQYIKVFIQALDLHRVLPGKPSPNSKLFSHLARSATRKTAGLLFETGSCLL